MLLKSSAPASIHEASQTELDRVVAFERREPVKARLQRFPMAPRIAADGQTALPQDPFPRRVGHLRGYGGITRCLIFLVQRHHDTRLRRILSFFVCGLKAGRNPF
jgi:hypothetical protein